MPLEKKRFVVNVPKLARSVNCEAYDEAEAKRIAAHHFGLLGSLPQGTIAYLEGKGPPGVETARKMPVRHAQPFDNMPAAQAAAAPAPEAAAAAQVDGDTEAY